MSPEESLSSSLEETECDELCGDYRTEDAQDIFPGRV